MVPHKATSNPTGIPNDQNIIHSFFENSFMMDDDKDKEKESLFQLRDHQGILYILKKRSRLQNEVYSPNYLQISVFSSKISLIHHLGLTIILLFNTLK